MNNLAISTDSFKAFQFWIVYEDHKMAMDAYLKTPAYSSSRLVKEFPPNLDVYYPSRDEKCEEIEPRTPMPPSWLIAITKGERGNLYHFRKFIKNRVGGMKNDQITRFRKSSFLIHAKSSAQAAMIANMKLEPESILK